MSLYNEISALILEDVLEIVYSIIETRNKETRLKKPGSINILANTVDLQFRKSSTDKNILMESSYDNSYISQVSNRNLSNSQSCLSSKKKSPASLDSNEKHFKKVMVTPGPYSYNSKISLNNSDEEQSIKKITKKIEEYDIKAKNRDMVIKSDRKSSLCNVSSQLDSIIEDFQE